MRAARPDFETRIVGRKLVTRGEIRPTPVNTLFRVRIELEPGQLPKSYVEDPLLRPRTPGEKIPHTYPGPRPCLFYPKANEWGSHMRLSETIVPWLAEWLFFYEFWLATGVWNGGGIPHGAEKNAAA